MNLKFKLEIDKKQIINLVVGISGIYSLFFLVGLFAEKILKHSYYNRITGAYEVFTHPIGLVVNNFITWYCCWLYNVLFYSEPLPPIPNKNTFMCALCIVGDSILTLYAIMYTSYPAVVMFKACNLLMIILIGILCSRVKDQNLKLSPKKIIVGIIVTIGVFLFQFFDPETRDRQLHAEILGIVFLTLTLFCDGFLPDFQAQIKSKFYPQPTKMLEQISKWALVLWFFVSCVSLQIFPTLKFLWEHLQFAFDVVAWSVLSVIGQFFVYRMIRHFKQHILPFVISTRKIFTVLLSILFYGHRTYWVQIIGFFIVLITVIVEFIIELKAESKRSRIKEKINFEEQID